MRYITKIGALALLLALCIAPVVRVEAKEKEFIDRNTLAEITVDVGRQYDIDPCLLYAICERESSLNIYAECGQCKGLMQVSSKWHSSRMERLGVDNLYDPYGNVLVAADYLRELIDENADLAYVLMRYNMCTNTANELYDQGIITDYATGILERSEALRNKAILEITNIKEQYDSVLPCGGVGEVLENM